MPTSDLILILDFGSQYTQLIARRVRELGVYSEIKPCYTPVDELLRARPSGIIFSGGPNSVYDPGAPSLDAKIFQQAVPILGVCYGQQLMTHLLGGKVIAAPGREYGSAQLDITTPDSLLANVGKNTTVWMSHGDFVEQLPPGFVPLATTSNSPFAAIAHPQKKFFGIQFHPEVAHTVAGRQILHNFVFGICGCSANWSPESFVEVAVRQIRAQVGDAQVICGLSGGVDSAVTAKLLQRAIGRQLHCVFVDHGLMRKDEGAQISATFKEQFGGAFIAVEAAALFLEKLRGVVDPELKRKIIGEQYIRVFEAEARKIPGVKFLAQGTLYPDVIESVSPRGGPSVTIKTHHNVGGLPEKMHLQLVEPLRELFKDEVRHCGRVLGLPEAILGRHPFPGPGLAVRILGEITPERLHWLREADAIFIDELKKSGWYDQVWQAFAVLLPIQSVGVMGDNRTYEMTIALRSVNSVDGMTADWSKLPHELLAHVSSRITNEVRGINRVVYDISSKPPSTIEWE
ncbi:MAG: GMP synthase [glutamine-hydrolyzing] [bacterium]|nr:GMP synthase [glutamine-hydrolyzing] [bacterium]